ncbi:hypothetical protein [Pedococcus bigeumensis]|uniref:DUF5666 domain-containing protein n=1 Tax=Pedococcus bigeumensis TaxID=433644 RepID=A0A502CS21_9MICO|nr:hypothetical protein [Pedococcus bigeumensis]TPG16027.1 hypothetical protein EAH86_12365 [Pedococcus bigeumensis]
MSTLTRAPWAATLVSVVLLVAACGGGNNATSPTSTSAPTTQRALGGAGSPGQARFPGASGLVAAVDGTTLQVQGTSTQTAVTYTSKTTFTNQVAAVSADVVVGACVAVRSATASETPPSASSSAQATQPVAASSVSISPAVDGACTAGFGRGGAGGLPGGPGQGVPGGGAAPSGIPGGAPSGTRTGRPDGTTGGRQGGFGAAFGRVTAVSAGGFTVASPVFERPTGTAGSASTTSPGSSSTTQTRTVSVTTSSQTTYTKTVRATAKAAAVGTCVTAEGKADDTGAIAATSVAVRPAENGSCSQGFLRGTAPTGATNG